MTICNKICPYKKDGKCSGVVPQKFNNIFFHINIECPYFENTNSASINHKRLNF